MEPATEFPAQRRASHVERLNPAHRVSLEARRRATGGAVEDRDGEGAIDRRNKKADRAARVARRSLRSEYATRRIAHPEKDGRGRSGSDRRNWQPETRFGRKA